MPKLLKLAWFNFKTKNRKKLNVSNKTLSQIGCTNEKPTDQRDIFMFFVVEFCGRNFIFSAKLEQIEQNLRKNGPEIFNFAFLPFNMGGKYGETCFVK